MCRGLGVATHSYSLLRHAERYSSRTEPDVCLVLYTWRVGETAPFKLGCKKFAAADLEILLE